MSVQPQRSLRRAYREWVEEQVEEFKDSIPRSQLLTIADQVVNELRMTRGGQYQLTELVLCDAIDRYLVRELKLPGYRAWAAQRRAALRPAPDPTIIPFPSPAPAMVAVPAVSTVSVADEADERVACVV